MRFETALAALEEKVAEAQKASEAVVKSLKKIRQAAAAGQIVELEKALAAIGAQAGEAESVARALAAAWSFDARAYLAAGYADELREAAKEEGVRLIERDGRLYAFPLLLKIEARDAAVRMGKKLERRLRPKRLARLLAVSQKHPQRLREERFLAVLYEVYREIAGVEWRKLERGPGPALSLEKVHGLLTLLPGVDYPVEEFGRDLLLLDRKPDLRTKDGDAFDFQGSALARGRMKPIRVFDESGNERVYIAIRFLKGR
jgi:hypothetical protein